MNAVEVTRKSVAEKLAAYLHHETTLEELAFWAGRILQEGNMEEGHEADLGLVLGRLGVANIRAFGLAWEDCEQLLAKLGYSARVDIATV